MGYSIVSLSKLRCLSPPPSSPRACLRNSQLGARLASLSALGHFSRLVSSHSLLTLFSVSASSRLAPPTRARARARERVGFQRFQSHSPHVPVTPRRCSRSW